jgi:Plavaka transposase
MSVYCSTKDRRNMSYEYFKRSRQEQSDTVNDNKLVCSFCGFEAKTAKELRHHHDWNHRYMNVVHENPVVRYGSSTGSVCTRQQHNELQISSSTPTRECNREDTGSLPYLAASHGNAGDDIGSAASPCSATSHGNDPDDIGSAISPGSVASRSNAGDESKDDKEEDDDEEEEDEDVGTPWHFMMPAGLPGQKYQPQPSVLPVSFVYRNDEVVEVLLLNLLRKLGSPMFGWKLIMDWAAYANRTGYNFDTCKTLQKCLEDLSRRFNMHDMKPQIGLATVDLSPCASATTQVEVVYFSVEAAVRSLLNDPMNRVSTNMVINRDDPFGKYVPSDPDIIDEVLSADVYQKNYHRFIPKDPKQNYFVVPLCLYMDSTNADVFGNFKVHPVMLSTTIHSLSVRRLYAGWRPIGLLPSIYDGYSSSDRAKMASREDGTGYAIRNLHACLDVIFKELVEIQQRGGIMFPKLTLNGVTKDDVLVITPIHMVMGDMEGSDDLAGKTGHHANITRACYCPYNEGDDTTHKCTFKKKRNRQINATTCYFQGASKIMSDMQSSSCR